MANRKPIHRCPCCQQPIPDPIGFQPAVRFGPVQQRMFDLLRRAPDGISAADLRDALYTGTNGGPQHNIVAVMARHMRPKLAQLGLRLDSTGGPGSVYRLIAEKD